jgi:GH43 family beta-xylosidase
MVDLSIPTTTAGQYTNPLPFSDGAKHTNPDPFGLKFRGRYYCYSTDRGGVNVSVSEDLVTWESLGYAFQRAGRKDFWAPCVVYYDGFFYMYVSTAPEDSTDAHDERLALAVSSSPVGPFEYVKTFFDVFSIDPHVVRDPDGSWWMFYSTNDVTGLNSGNAGTSILVDRMLGFDRLAGDPRPVVVPTLREEIFAENRFGDGRDWYTIEGATYFTHGRNAFLTYSGNAYVRENYFVGYARAQRTGSIGDLVWSKYPSDYDFAPLIRRNTGVEGTGHNSILIGPDLAETWIMYHARDADDQLVDGVEQRTMRVDRLYFDGDRLTTDAPTYTPQAAPAMPDFRDLFPGVALSVDWEVIDGRFDVRDGAAHSDAESPQSVALTRARFESYRAEIDIAAQVSHVGARFGVIPVFISADEFTEVLLDSASRTISAVRVSRGISSTVARAPLGDIDISAFHNLTVDRTFDRVDVGLDGRALLTFPAPEGPSAFGMSARRTSAAFSSVSINGHLELVGAGLAEIGRMFTATPRAEVDDSGVNARNGEVQLRSSWLPADWSHTFELELLSRQRGRVRLDLIDAQDVVTTIEVTSAGVQIRREAGNGTRVLLEAPLAETAFSIHIRSRDDQTDVRVAGNTCRFATAAGPVSHRLSLTASRLRGFEAGSTAANP